MPGEQGGHLGCLYSKEILLIILLSEVLLAVMITARELCSLGFCFFGAATLLFAYEISGESLNRFAQNLQERRVWTVARKSLNVTVKRQRSRSPRTKRHFSALRAVCLAKHL